MRRSQFGFTLLEVMVALIIFAFSALVILQQSTKSVHQLSMLQDKTLALWVAENALAKIKLETQWPSAGKTEYVVSNAGREWNITQQIEDTSNESLRKIIVDISREDASNNTNASDFSLVTLTGYIGEH